MSWPRIVLAQDSLVGWAFLVLLSSDPLTFIFNSFLFMLEVVWAWENQEALHQSQQGQSETGMPGIKETI